jgi:hypothetical protein
VDRSTVRAPQHTFARLPLYRLCAAVIMCRRDILQTPNVAKFKHHACLCPQMLQHYKALPPLRTVDIPTLSLDSQPHTVVACLVLLQACLLRWCSWFTPAVSPPPTSSNCSSHHWLRAATAWSPSTGPAGCSRAQHQQGQLVGTI